jgi:hypothetical protein
MRLSESLVNMVFLLREMDWKHRERGEMKSTHFCEEMQTCIDWSFKVLIL